MLLSSYQNQTKQKQQQKKQTKQKTKQNKTEVEVWERVDIGVKGGSGCTEKGYHVLDDR